MKQIIIALFCLIGLSSQAQLDSFNVGDIAPNFTVTDVNGTDHTLYTYIDSGKYVLLNFFVTDCGFCGTAMNTLSQFNDVFGCGDGDVIVLGIDSGSTDATVSSFANTHNAGVPVQVASGLEGGGDSVSSLYGPSNFPTFAIIGPDTQFVAIDIFPIADSASFINAFPDSSITPTGCLLSVNEQQVAGELGPLFPNPVQERTTVSYALRVPAVVSFQLYNLLGERVWSYETGKQGSGTHQQAMQLNDYEAGIYLLQVFADGAWIGTKKLEVVR